jgi:hypothetical protein
LSLNPITLLSRTHVRGTSTTWIYLRLYTSNTHMNIYMQINIHMHMNIHMKCEYLHTCVQAYVRTVTSKDQDTQTGTTCTCTRMCFQKKKILPPKNTCTCCEGVHVHIFGTCTRAKHTNSHAMTCNDHAHMQHARAACHMCICIFIVGCI